MIFVVLGSQKFQFNRLLEAIDELKMASMIEDEIVAQVGYSDYVPKSFQAIDFVSKNEFDDYISKADYVICHGGTGAIISSLKKGKKVIAVPRNSKFGEHVDEHQYQIVQMFSDLKLIEPCYDTEDLFQALMNSDETRYEVFKSNNEVFVNAIRKDIEQIARESK